VQRRGGGGSKTGGKKYGRRGFAAKEWWGGKGSRAPRAVVTAGKLLLGTDQHQHAPAPCPLQSPQLLGSPEWGVLLEADQLT